MSPPLEPLVLLVPSRAPDPAAVRELPRRWATIEGALAGVYPFRILTLARALAEPALLGSGRRPWDSGHVAHLAGRLLDQTPDLRLDPSLPRGPVARTLAATLRELRMAGAPVDAVAALATDADTDEDRARLRALARIYGRYHEAAEAQAADAATLLRTAAERIDQAGFLRNARVLLVDDGELEPVEEAFLEALAARLPVMRLDRPRPAGLRAGSFAERAATLGVVAVAPEASELAPVFPASLPGGLDRLRRSLFEPAQGDPIRDGSVSLLTAPGEAAEVRTLVRRLLREAARGVPFEDMGVIVPRADVYAPLVADLLGRLGIPARLHPSLPLSSGRIARSLLLLLRCRGLSRAAVMELLTFAPVRFEALLGPGTAAVPARWDQVSRDAGIVSEYGRWLIGLRAFAEGERRAGQTEDEPRRARREARAGDAESLLRLVELLSGTLDALAGDASWTEWSERLRGVLAQWIHPGRDAGDDGRQLARQEIDEYEKLDGVLAGLSALDSLESGKRGVAWADVEGVVEARLESERLPLVEAGDACVHVGALDAMAGLPFRVVAIPGLVEGGYPGALRPDPFLLDAERDRLNRWISERGTSGVGSSPAGRADADPFPPAATSPAPHPPGHTPSVPDPSLLRPASPSRRSRAASDSRQLPLFSPPSAPPAAAPAPGSEPSVAGPAPPASAVPAPVAPSRCALPTTQDRLREARRLFHRAVSQATERLYLSYPRADARSGRERLPSLFLVAAASTLEGRPVDADDLERLVEEDTLAALSLEEAVDRGERDRARMLRSGDEAESAIASGSAFFRQSRLAHKARWNSRLSAYDGLIAPLPDEAAAKLNPSTAGRSTSASRLAVYTRCGFQYLLQNVLRLEAALEPEERIRLEPLERGSLFHDVAERFLRERRDRDELPVRDEPETRERLIEMGDEALDGLVRGSPPRYTVLWERERRRFHDTLLGWLSREAAQAHRSVPAWFEVGFGLPRAPGTGEPHTDDPLEIDLGEGRTLRVAGRIDRIDRRPEGGLVLRDYKTGRAPRDDGSLFRGGKQLQIPFYLLAVEKLLPDEPVIEAFLDYVDGGRRVSVDPAYVRGERFPSLLRTLCDAIGSGVFVQEPAACDWCDFTQVCGPAPLLRARRGIKIHDKLVQRYLQLRDLG